MTNVDASWALGDIEQGASILHETPLLAIQVLFSFLFFSFPSILAIQVQYLKRDE